MKRKLIKQGGSGLVAYIPKKWIDEKNLKPGDEISLVEEEGDLIVSAETKDTKKQINLDLSLEDPLFIKLIINDLYRGGYDKMILTYNSKQQLETISETIDQFLLGFEIVEKTESKLTLENVAVPDAEKQEVLLRRIFLIIDEIFEIIQEDMEKGSFTKQAQLFNLKKKIGQYDNFSRRNISKKKFYQESSSFSWVLYNHLYLITHSLIHLYEVLKSNKGHFVSKKIVEIMGELHKFYSALYNGFFKKDLENLKSLNSKLNNFLYKEVHPELEKTKGKDSLVLYYLGEISRLLYKTNSPILGILLGSERKR